ncbi:MAG TPA: hypothetical protein PK275_08755 [Chitinophagaceae bacterium]|nr:hypothetical protein [Chitinophagaceae bacterium]
MIKKKGGFMYSYDLLEIGCYYLVKEKKDTAVTLIKVVLATDHCLFIQRYDNLSATGWNLKKDSLFDIIECLSDEKAKEWESQYKGLHFPFMEEGDED